MKITVELSRRNVETIAKVADVTIEQIMENSSMNESCDAGTVDMDATVEGGVSASVSIDDEFIDEIVSTFIAPFVSICKSFQPAIEKFTARWFEPTSVVTESFILTAGRKTFNVKFNEGYDITDANIEELKSERKGVQKYRPEHLAMFDLAVEDVVAVAFHQKLADVTEE